MIFFIMHVLSFKNDLSYLKIKKILNFPDAIEFLVEYSLTFGS